MYVIWNGDTVLCYCDDSRTVLHGNVAQFSIAAVWGTTTATKSYIKRAAQEKSFPRSAATAKCLCLPEPPSVAG